MNIIEVTDLVKTYTNEKKALNKVTFSVKKGEIFSLLGMNGAGKSTLINILTTYLSPTGGKVQLLGKDAVTDKDDIRSKIACVPQRLSIDEYLTFKENLIFQSRLYGLDRDLFQPRISQLLKMFGLEEFLNTKVCECSGGIKRRMDIVTNLIPYPEILFLDEPTVALDVQSRQAMWNMLTTIKEQLGITIILTTHYLEEADLLSDTLCFIKEGKIIMQGTTKDLKHLLRPNIIRIQVEENNASTYLKSIFLQLKYVHSVNVQNNQLDLHVLNCTQNIKEINKILLSEKIMFTILEIVEPTLEDLFVIIMGGKTNENL